MRLDDKESTIYFPGPGPEIEGKLPNIFRSAEPVEDEIDHVDQKGLEQQGQGPAGKQSIDPFAGDVADIVAADVAAHGGIDDQGQIGNTAEEEMTEQVKSLEDKGEQVEMKDGKEQNQGNPLMEATFETDLEKVDSSFQGEKFGRNVLPFALDHIELLDFRDGTEQVLGFVDPATVGGDDLGIGVAWPFYFPFLGHQIS